MNISSYGAVEAQPVIKECGQSVVRVRRRAQASLYYVSVLITGIVAFGAFNKESLRKRQDCGYITCPLTSYA